ncbi:hypothetical protein [Microvirga yunnanensis]|uniref:hypothetical protein n=1 Tax=Microvirga yunnanensis TaxID=2953740 RepID=UPI0021C5BC29|nr:hypothetical protein [Microvirga sp. HBU65207]
MTISPQHLRSQSFFWDADGQSTSRSHHKLEQFYTSCRRRWQSVKTGSAVARSNLNQILRTLDRMLLAPAVLILPKAYASWGTVRPVFLSRAQAWLPWLSLATAQQEDEEPDPAWALLEDLQNLKADQQDKTAKNLALLWKSFEDSFGGLSGYLQSLETEQLLYLNKLKAASDRMRLARGTEAAFHYVTVELMRQYVGCFQAGRSDQAAMALATCVSGLIDRGRC